jgi:hypothetical protein
LNDIYQALARTALLIEVDIFPCTDHRVIIDGLRATTVRIISNRANIASPAGQTALVTLYVLLAMLGLQIDLDVPAARLAIDQPPLRGSDVVAGLLDYSADLLPGGSAQPSPIPDVTFALGDTPAPSGAVRVSGTGCTGAAGSLAPALRWQGIWPVGAMAAAAAAAAEGLRAAVPRIADRAGRPLPADPRWRTIPGRQVVLDLGRYRAEGPIRIGAVDVISGGAITNATLYALLRMPAVTAAMRIIEQDLLDLPNLNRYALARRSMMDWPKTRALEAFQTPAITITGHEQFFDDATAAGLAPIAPRLLVGVDRIPSRWDAQRAIGPGWVCTGSSSHDFVLVSAHPAGAACAGCVHPRDENIAGDIPTISFVSFWAGLIQALELVATATGHAPAWTRSTNIWPLGLDNPRGIHPFRQEAFIRCPVGCRASAALQPGTGTEVHAAAATRLAAAGPYTAAWPE